MNEWIDSLGEVTICSILNANCGFLWIKIEEFGRSKTTFISSHGLQWFICIASGMQNKPGKFERTTGIILFTVRRHFCTRIPGRYFCYLKNIDRTIWPQLARTHAPLRRWSNTQPQKMWVFHWQPRLPRPRHTTSTARNIITHNQWGTWIETANLTHKSRNVLQAAQLFQSLCFQVHMTCNITARATTKVTIGLF